MSKGEIAKWYAGKSVFITGASGFMGKVLLEKLLFGCPELKNVYILIRAKRGRTPDQRVQDMWKLPMFQRLRTQYPDAIKKVVPINGDLITEALGISSQDRSLVTREVNVVFHMAATLKLEGTLKDAIDMNTAGTQRVIELCKEMKNLQALVHLSTAFCNCDIEVMKEEVYDCKDDPHEVMRTVKWMDDKALIKATTDLIAPHPNTYTYSKRLAEILIKEQFPNLPVAVTRPSIVCPAIEEPVAGWVDNLNGPVGLLVAAGKGVLRTMQCNTEYSAHIVPVDRAINALIAIGWKTGVMYATSKPKEIPVYNMSQDGIIKATYGEVLNIGRKIIYDYPFEMCVWYPGGDFHKSTIIHWLYIIFLHFLPAYFIDFLMILFRQKRFMVRLQWRILQGLDLLQFFTTRQWNFVCTNFYELWDNMSAEDRRRFSIDFKSIDIPTYLKICLLGARQYCMKEDLSSLPRCRIKQKFLYVLDKVTIFGFCYLILSLLGSIFAPIRYLLDCVKAFLSSIF